MLDASFFVCVRAQTMIHSLVLHVAVLEIFLSVCVCVCVLIAQCATGVQLHPASNANQSDSGPSEAA